MSQPGNEFQFEQYLQGNWWEGMDPALAEELAKDEETREEFVRAGEDFVMLAEASKEHHEETKRLKKADLERKESDEAATGQPESV